MDGSGDTRPELVLSRLPNLYAFEGEVKGPRHKSDLLLLSLFAALHVAKLTDLGNRRKDTGMLRSAWQAHLILQ